MILVFTCARRINKATTSYYLFPTLLLYIKCLPVAKTTQLVLLHKWEVREYNVVMSALMIHEAIVIKFSFCDSEKHHFYLFCSHYVCTILSAYNVDKIKCIKVSFKKIVKIAFVFNDLISISDHSHFIYTNEYFYLLFIYP